MSQITSFGEATVVTYMKIQNVSGACRYFRVQGETTTQIDEETYRKESGDTTKKGVWQLRWDYLVARVREIIRRR